VDFEIIDASDIVAVRRGRKSTVPPELVKVLKELPKGKAVRMTTMKCDPKSASFRNDKASRGATIRGAGKVAGVKVSIAWTPDGVPQVTVEAKGK